MTAKDAAVAILLAAAPPSAAAYTSAWVTPFDGFEPRELACFDVVNVFALDFDGRNEIFVAHPELLDAAARGKRPGALLIATIVNDVEHGALKSQDVLRYWLADEKRIGQHADDIVKAVERFDGVELDYERMPDDLWPAFVKLVGKVGERLHAQGKRVEVAVEAAPLYRGGGAVARAQWPALGAAADRVKVMCYYERGDFSDRPGPGTSQAWVEGTAKKALALLPPEKVSLAFSLAATDWEVPLPALRTKRQVKRLHFKQAEKLKSEIGGEPQWDDAFGSPLWRYRKDGRDHEVWYEDEKTLGRKVDAARRLGAGVSLWYLGLRHPDLAASGLCPAKGS
jgi:spore germination protein YaaH